MLAAFCLHLTLTLGFALALGSKDWFAHVVSQDLVPCKARKTHLLGPTADEWRAQGSRMKLGLEASPADAAGIAEQ